jgi:hypothetical protein
MPTIRAKRAALSSTGWCEKIAAKNRTPVSGVLTIVTAPATSRTLGKRVARGATGVAGESLTLGPSFGRRRFVEHLW